MIIYKVTNKMNGKVYIGKTTKEITLRKSQHINASKNKNLALYDTVFYRALRKYGEDNFIWEVIDSSESEDGLAEREIYWIDYFKSYIHRENCNGYNMTIGGEGTTGSKHSDEAKLKFSKRAKEEFCGEGNPMFGKKHSEKSIYKNSISQPNRRHILQFSDDGTLIKEYISLVEVEKELNIDRTSISKTCKGKYAHSLYFIWIYKDEYSLELLNERVEKYKEFTSNKGIIQLTKDGEFIKEYSDTVECAKEINGDRSSITKCCKGKLKTHRGYVFKYKTEYYNEVIS